MDAIEKLRELQGELGAQGERLEARAREIAQMVAALPEAERSAVSIAAEAFEEVVETGIEFQKSLVDIVIELAEEAPPGGDGDGDIGIEPEDAEVIRPPLEEYVALLEAMLPQAPAAEAAELNKKRAGALAAIARLDELILVDDDEDEDEPPESGPQGKN